MDSMEPLFLTLTYPFGFQVVFCVQSLQAYSCLSTLTSHEHKEANRPSHHYLLIGHCCPDCTSENRNLKFSRREGHSQTPQKGRVALLPHNHLQTPFNSPVSATDNLHNFPWYRLRSQVRLGGAGGIYCVSLCYTHVGQTTTSSFYCPKAATSYT